MRRRAVTVLTVTVFALYLLLWGCPHYDLGDDAILMDSLMGAVGGVQESFNHHVLFPLFGLLHLLSRAFPGVAWFSICQLGMLCLAAYVTVSSGIRLSERLRLSPVIGWASATLCAWVFIVPFGNFISYTQTAVVLGMAGVWQAACIDWRGKYAPSLARSILCLLLGFCLRWESALPAFCFWLGVLLCAWLVEKAPLRRVLTGGLICAAVMAIAMGIHLAAAASEADYERFQKARINVVDYGALSSVPPETLDNIGWTETDVALAGDWCLLDKRVTAEALETIAQDAPVSFSLQDAVQRIRLLVQKNRSVYWIGVLSVVLLGAAFGLALLKPYIYIYIYELLLPVACAAGTALLLFLLALRGRLPMRAAAAVLFPACAAGMYLAFVNGAALYRSGGWRRLLSLAAALVCMVVMIPNVRQAFYNSYQPYPLSRESVYTRIERYALNHPDEFLIASNDLGRDPRLFPDRSAGIPQNLLLGWGSWNNHSAGYRTVFENFGYTHDGFGIECFVNSRIRLITPDHTQPPEALVRAIEERMGAEVSWEMEAQDGFWIYKFIQK